MSKRMDRILSDRLENADKPGMERRTLPPVENEIQFLLSLLRISAPEQSCSEQAAALEQLLPATATR